ncbi:MAG TPA: O-antigen ligase family protein [Acidocella sp.]|nr:O-antigen ligase family protein [Acidocella sp.]
MTTLELGLGGVGLLCAFGVALWLPVAAVVLWVLFLETSPDIWLTGLIGGYETIIGAMKGIGLALALALALRGGVKPDRYNPGFAFGAMFITGLAHGLYPGLSLLSSVRSLVGSAAPFAFGFVKPPLAWSRAVIRTVIVAPFCTLLFGAALQVAGVHAMYDLEQGALRLGASGEPAFLAGFALIGIYAGLVELSAAVRWVEAMWLLVNFAILFATGARVPLALAVVVAVFAVLQPNSPFAARGKIMFLAACGALASLAVIFASALSFIRVFDLVQLGEAGNLSHRDLVWPYFEAAIAGSPWVGWGVGAGKFVLPVTSTLSATIGTNAAHNEYLRIGAEGGFIGLTLLVVFIGLWAWRGSRILAPAQRGLLRLIFIAFALHAATDNVLIATTSSIFFVWVSALFATPPQAPKGEA